MIRPAYSEDIDQMAGLLSELFTIEDDFVIDREKQIRALQMLLENPDALVLVVEAEGKIVGMASLQRLISTAAGEYVGLIEDVVVTQKFRGKGIGRSLFESVLSEAKARGYARLQMAVLSDNVAASHFYAQFGFQRSSMLMFYKTLH